MAAEFAVVHDSVGLHREVLAAGSAPVRHRPAARHRRHSIAVAVWADRAVGPAPRLELGFGFAAVSGVSVEERSEAHAVLDDLVRFAHTLYDPIGV